MRFLGLFLLSFSALAGTVERHTPNAFTIELNRTFFGDLSQHLLKYELKDIVQEALPDEHGQNSDFTYSIEGMYFSVDFKDFSIRPIDGMLQFMVGVGDVHLHAGTLRGKSRKVGSVKAKCYDVDVHIARGSKLISKAKLGTKIVDGKLKLDLAELQFDIPEDQFRVEGPRKCKGLIGKLLKGQVPKLIKKQRPKLIEQVRQELIDKIPSFERQLNEKIIFEEEFDLGDIIFFPPSKIKITLKPSELILTPEKMQLYYSAHMAGDHTEPLKLPTPPMQIEGKRYGHFGIHTDVLNNLFAVTFPEGVPYVDLTDGSIPETKEFFTSQGFIEIVPDLVHFGEDEDVPLKGFMALDGVPHISITEEGLISFRLPDILLKLQVPEGEIFRDYHVFRITLKPEVEVRQTEKKIELYLSGVNDLSIAGLWSEGFPYNDPLVNYELFELTFQALLGTLIGEDPLATFNVPDIRVGDIELDAQLHLQAPYLGVILGRQ